MIFFCHAEGFFEFAVEDVGAGEELFEALRWVRIRVVRR